MTNGENDDAETLDDAAQSSPMRAEPPAPQDPTTPTTGSAASGTMPGQSSPWERVKLTTAENFWYIILCIDFGAGYLRKVPTKKALTEVGRAEMTGAEKFWYVLLCISFGYGYLMKVPTKKAFSETSTAA